MTSWVVAYLYILGAVDNHLLLKDIDGVSNARWFLVVFLWPAYTLFLICGEVLDYVKHKRR